MLMFFTPMAVIKHIEKVEMNMKSQTLIESKNLLVYSFKYLSIFKYLSGI